MSRQRLVGIAIAIATSFALLPSPVEASPPATIELSGIVHDFKRNHPDFNVLPIGGPGHYAANVDLMLGSDGRPVYRGAGFKVGVEWLDPDGQQIAPHLFGQAGTSPEPPTADDCGPLDVLLVVVNDVTLTSQDAAKQAALEAMGHTVTVIDDEATQPQIDAAVAFNDVVYISEHSSNVLADVTAISAASAPTPGRS